MASDIYIYVCVYLCICLYAQHHPHRRSLIDCECKCVLYRETKRGTRIWVPPLANHLDRLESLEHFLVHILLPGGKMGWHGMTWVLAHTTIPKIPQDVLVRCQKLTDSKTTSQVWWCTSTAHLSTKKNTCWMSFISPLWLNNERSYTTKGRGFTEANCGLS